MKLSKAQERLLSLIIKHCKGTWIDYWGLPRPYKGTSLTKLLPALNRLDHLGLVMTERRATDHFVRINVIPTQKGLDKTLF